MKKMISVCAVISMLLMTSCTDTSHQSLDVTSDLPDSVSENAVPVEDVTITIASCGTFSPSLQMKIDQFNTADNGYQIVIKDYLEYYDGSYGIENGRSVEGLEQVALKLYLDIIEGGKVDIIPESTLCWDYGKFDVLLERGAFIDLYPLIDADPEIGRTMLNEHVLSAHEVNGKLYALPCFFTINTLIGQSRYVGEKENWNMDELISCWEAMPEDSNFCGVTNKDTIYRTILKGNMGSFVNYQESTVSFNTPTFVRMLNFCNAFPDSKMYKTDPDWSVPSFLEQQSFRGFENFHMSLWNEADEPVTFVGYPSENGNGAFIDTTGQKYGVCTTSSVEIQEGAWQFLRSLLSCDYQYRYSSAYGEDVGFPINLEAFEKKGKEQTKKSGQSNVISMSGVEYDVGYLSQEEYDRLIAYIDSIDQVSRSIEQPVWTIIDEEIGAFFAGEVTAEEVAKAIQGRASIFVSEKT